MSINPKSKEYFQYMQYQECQKGQYHQGEVLNCVCIDQSCSQNELVCSICQQEQHNNHLVIPLKIFMESIYNIDNKNQNEKDIKDKNKDSINGSVNQSDKKIKEEMIAQQQNTQTQTKSLKNGNGNYFNGNKSSYYAQQLEEIDRQHQLAQKYIKDYQDKIITGFKECIDKIDTFYKGIKAEIQKKQYLQDTWLQKFQESLLKSQENIQLVKQHENLIQNKNERKQTDQIINSQISNSYQDCIINKSIKDMLQIIGFDQSNEFKCFYKMDFDYVIQLCQQRYSKFVVNKDADAFLTSINNFSKKCDEIYGEIPSLSSSQCSQTNLNNLQLSQFLKLIRFSDSFKGAAIQIKIPTIATQTQNESSGQRFCLLEPCLSHSNRLRWGFKIKNLVGWIGIGFNYQFKYTNIGHGSYLLSGNGYTWSHSKLSQNSINKSFHFTTGDSIYIEFDPIEKKLKYIKQLTLEAYTLELDFVDTDEIVPCVNLCSVGDEIEVITDEKELSSLKF